MVFDNDFHKVNTALLGSNFMKRELDINNPDKEALTAHPIAAWRTYIYI